MRVQHSRVAFNRRCQENITLPALHATDFTVNAAIWCLLHELCSQNCPISQLLVCLVRECSVTTMVFGVGPLRCLLFTLEAVIFVFLTHVPGLPFPFPHNRLFLSMWIAYDITKISGLGKSSTFAIATYVGCCSHYFQIIIVPQKYYSKYILHHYTRLIIRYLLNLAVYNRLILRGNNDWQISHNKVAYYNVQHNLWTFGPQ